MTVLIADDEPLVRKGIISTLKELKEEFDIGSIFECHNGAGAIERLRVSPIDIVFTDILMPEVDGIALLRWIHEQRLPCQCIVLSCHDDYEYVRGAFQHSALDYVLKYDIDEDTIRSLLRHAATSLGTFSSLPSDPILPSETFPTWVVWLELSQEPDSTSVRELSEAFAWPSKSNGEEDSEENSVLLSQEGTTLVLAYQSEETVTLSELLNGYRRAIKGGPISGKTVLGVGLSGVFSGSEHLAAAVRSAEESLQQRFYGGPGDVFGPETGGRSFDLERESATLLEWKARFIRDLSTGEPSVVAQWFETFEQEARRRRFSPESVRRLLRDIVDLLEVFLAERRERLDPALKIGLQGRIDEEPYLGALGAHLRSALVGNLSARRHPFLDTVGNTGVRRALEIIHADYCSPGLSLSSVAEELHYSPSYLSRAFAKEMGTPLVTYINNLRLDDARRLLREGTYYVYEVAELVGFSSYNYFSKLYSRRFGSSPGRENIDVPVEASK
ncbi:MAG: response regulator [Spirochaetaceae bacterium]